MANIHQTTVQVLIMTQSMTKSIIHTNKGTQQNLKSVTLLIASRGDHQYLIVWARQCTGTTHFATARNTQYQPEVASLPLL